MFEDLYELFLPLPSPAKLTKSPTYITWTGSPRLSSLPPPSFLDTMQPKLCPSVRMYAWSSLHWKMRRWLSTETLSTSTDVFPRHATAVFPFVFAVCLAAYIQLTAAIGTPGECLYGRTIYPSVVNFVGKPPTKTLKSYALPPSFLPIPFLLPLHPPGHWQEHRADHMAGLCSKSYAQGGIEMMEKRIQLDSMLKYISFFDIVISSYLTMFFFFLQETSQKNFNWYICILPPSLWRWAGYCHCVAFP